MRMSDWSSDVCSSDLGPTIAGNRHKPPTSVIRPRLINISPNLASSEAMRISAKSVRSEERRVGKECVSTCRSRWSPYHYKKKKQNQNRKQSVGYECIQKHKCKKR